MLLRQSPMRGNLTLGLYEPLGAREDGVAAAAPGETASAVAAARAEQPSQASRSARSDRGEDALPAGGAPAAASVRFAAGGGVPPGPTHPHGGGPQLPPRRPPAPAR